MSHKIHLRHLARGHCSCAALCLALVSFSAAGIGSAMAQSASAESQTINLNLGSVTATSFGPYGLDDNASAASPGSAAAAAPSRTPFNATQPTSQVSRAYIDKSVSPTGNYDDAIKFTPSLANVEPNGPGLQESKSLSIRGFQDGQYNITFDGIPYAGDPTSNHHESAVYFTDNDLGSVSIDRGPGTASDLGDATFGGTIAITSKDPLNLLTITPYASYGSFDTYQAGLEADSGPIAAANGASGFIDVQHDGTDGYLTNSAGRRNNIFGKIAVPLNSHTVITFVALENHTVQNTPQGATLAEINKYGPNYGLNNNPTSQDFEGYNINTYSTDFEYVGLQTTLPYDISLDDKLYTNAFYHTTLEGTDPNGTGANLTSKVATSSKTGTAYYLDGELTTLNNAVPGKAGLQDYRGYGNIIRLAVPIPFGSFRFGLWVEHEVNSYSQVSVVLSADDDTETKVTIPAKATPAATSALSPYSFLLDDSANTIQPFAEFDLTPLPGLTLTPGFKFTGFGRGINAQINKSTKLPSNTYQLYTDFEPSFEIRYVPVRDVSVYAQAAKGFLQPPLNAFFTTEIAPLKPESTWNYQVGTAYQTHNTTLSADAYYINFSNFIQSNIVGGNTIYSNGGGVIYKGLEFEGTQNIAYGFSLYGNFTLNSAVYTNGGATVAQAPRRTMAAGVIYNQGPFSASFIDKIIGPQYGQDSSGGSAAPADAFPIKSYNEADAAAAYTMALFHGHPATLKLNIDNVFDNTSLVQLAGLAADAATPLYFTDPGRSVFGSVAIGF